VTTRVRFVDDKPGAVSYETSVNQYQGNEIENDQLYEIIGNEV
jgi:hypothetical protein